MVKNNTNLAWACRRGMLELDVLLGNFLKEAYPNLSDEDKQHFVDLLSSADPELFTWLLGREQPQDQGLAKITEMIRSHARSRI
jgi:antitoxin CptB